MPHFPSAGQVGAPTMAGNPATALQIPAHETEEAREARIQIKDRRRRYLDLHPEYFESPSLELAGVVA